MALTVGVIAAFVGFGMAWAGATPLHCWLLLGIGGLLLVGLERERTRPAGRDFARDVRRLARPDALRRRDRP